MEEIVRMQGKLMPVQTNIFILFIFFILFT